MADPVFVGAGAVRIQQWIARTPLLRLSRGASRALTCLTGADHIDALLQRYPCPARRATEAPDVDGVIALRLDDPAGLDDALRWLRRRVAAALPGVEWKVWAHQAPTYVAAFHAAAHEQVLSSGRWHWPPCELDLNLAASCHGCRQESAVCTVSLPGEEKPVGLGLDCLVRLDYTRDATNTRAWTFDDLAKRGGVSPTPAAAATTIGRGEADNHLATIAADGNRFGALFERLSQIPALPYEVDGQSTTVHARISAHLHTTAKAAADTAARVRDADAAVTCSIDHVIGGDDLLVSVAARFAWSYVRCLLTTFEQQVREGLGMIIDDAASRPGVLDADAADALRTSTGRISLGVGVAFANRKHPFAHTTELAQQALAAAKRAGQGEQSAVCWVDLTVESTVPRHRSAFPGELEHDPDVFDYNPSARLTLTGLIRDGWNRGECVDQPGYDAAAAEIGAEVAAWGMRVGKTPLGFGPVDEKALRQLESDLDRARWWPSTNPEAR